MSALNHILIRGTQIMGKIGRSLASKNIYEHLPEPPLEDVRVSCLDQPPSKRALLSLLPSAWKRAEAQAPHIKIFNIDGFSYEVVRALNEKGYSVDMVDYRDKTFTPQKSYDFYLGHAGYSTTLLEALPPETFVLNYASGAYWKEFNRMSQERYENFYRRVGARQSPAFTRSLNGTEPGEEKLAQRADAMFIAGPRTAATYAGSSCNIKSLYLGAYVEKDYLVADRNFEAGRKNFIYVAGTGGNIQKGMDLLIEAFAGMPDLHLYIYCKIEPEILAAYGKELGLPNIHYVYHYSKRLLRSRMKQLLRNINFTLGAPINTGVGTAMLGSLGLGLIPVGYIDIEAGVENSVLTNSFEIEAIMAAARQASQKSAAWCREASRQTLERFAWLHEPVPWGRNFKDLLDSLGL